MPSTLPLFAKPSNRAALLGGRTSKPGEKNRITGTTGTTGIGLDLPRLSSNSSNLRGCWDFSQFD